MITHGTVIFGTRDQLTAESIGLPPGWTLRQEPDEFVTVVSPHGWRFYLNDDHSLILSDALPDITAARIPISALASQDVRDLIACACTEILGMLLAKNAAYGNSALEPLRIFAKDADTVEQLNVRIDDKLSRVARGHAAGEDVEADLIGYLVLKRVKREMEKRACVVPQTRVDSTAG